MDKPTPAQEAQPREGLQLDVNGHQFAFVSDELQALPCPRCGKYPDEVAGGQMPCGG